MPSLDTVKPKTIETRCVQRTTKLTPLVTLQQHTSVVVAVTNSLPLMKKGCIFEAQEIIQQILFALLRELLTSEIPNNYQNL